MTAVDTFKVPSAMYDDDTFKSSRNYEYAITRGCAEGIINRTENCKYLSGLRTSIHAMIKILDNAHNTCVHHDATLAYSEATYDAASAEADGDYECMDEDTIVIVESDYKANHDAACAAYDAYVVADDSAYDARHKLWHVIKHIKAAIEIYNSMIPWAAKFEL
jgi:hypothetical protein